MTTRRLINCPTCSGSDKSTRNIWDVDFYDRTRTCRCCGTTVKLKAVPVAIRAKRAERNTKMEALLQSLLAEIANTTEGTL
jgi:uncharacterized Zn finger protein